MRYSREPSMLPYETCGVADALCYHVETTRWSQKAAGREVVLFVHFWRSVVGTLHGRNLAGFQRNWGRWGECNTSWLKDPPLVTNLLLTLLFLFSASLVMTAACIAAVLLPRSWVVWSSCPLLSLAWLVNHTALILASPAVTWAIGLASVCMCCSRAEIWCLLNWSVYCEGFQ